MAYDTELADRVREQLASERAVSEKKMFGGLAFLIGGNMAVAVSHRGGLIVRVGEEAYEAALEEPHAQVFDMSGRPMRGWVFVEADGLANDDDVAAWVSRGAAFAASLPAKGQDQ